MMKMDSRTMMHSIFCFKSWMLCLWKRISRGSQCISKNISKWNCVILWCALFNSI